MAEKNNKAVCINMDKDDDKYLKSEGINKSKLMRQVTKAIKEKTFIYQYI